VNESNLHIVKVYSVDYDTERELVEKFSVRNLPDIYAFKNGRLVGAAIHCTNDNELSLLFGGNFSC
jgi:thioredoxin-like negative regulator of GroEL